MTSDADGPTLHLAQLISGRVKASAAITGVKDAVVAVTFLRGAGLVVGDAAGVLWRIGVSGRAERLTALEYVPTGLAPDGNGGLLVSAGGPRLARFSAATLRKTGVVELEAGVPTDGPFVTSSGRLLYLVAADDGYEIRSAPLK